MKKWMPRFLVNQLVKGRIMSVDPINQNVEPTIRPGSLSGFGSICVFSVRLAGRPKDRGSRQRSNFMALFIEIESLDYVIRLAVQQQNADSTLGQRSFREGDIVKAIVCSVRSTSKNDAYRSI
ncbi:hypothetical protein BJY52DRAFT_547595 [Lactarius psammicola]|nr:hypothetical protein BJY52DRAFT_547595 [Lactarius psammicola]